MIYIENTSKDKVLEANIDGKVIQEDKEDKAEQLWKKGKKDNEGYFTLENSGESPKVLTAISISGLEIKEGNITLHSMLRLDATFQIRKFLYQTSNFHYRNCVLRKSPCTEKKLKFVFSTVFLRESCFCFFYHFFQNLKCLNNKISTLIARKSALKWHNYRMF